MSMSIPDRKNPTAIAVLCIAVVGVIIALSLLRINQPVGDAASAQPDLSKALIPFVLIATGIERLWEAFFSFWESTAITLGRRLPGTPDGSAPELEKALADALTEAGQAATILRELAPNVTSDEKTAAEKRVFEAKQKVVTAQQALYNHVSGTGYSLFKRGVTSLGSLVLGIAVAIGWQLKIFAQAGIAMPPAADILATGLLIGAGPGPIHALINLLTEVRNVTAGLADAARGTGLQKAADAVNPATTNSVPVKPVRIVVTPLASTAASPVSRQAEDIIRAQKATEIIRPRRT